MKTPVSNIKHRLGLSVSLVIFVVLLAVTGAAADALVASATAAALFGAMLDAYSPARRVAVRRHHVALPSVVPLPRRVQARSARPATSAPARSATHDYIRHGTRTLAIYPSAH